MEATSTTSQEVMDDIRTVMSATSANGLFGTNSKRARICYRRLAKSVHPDSNHGAPGSRDAMVRLNALWEEYNKGNGTIRHDTKHKAATKATRDVRELTRTGCVAVFDEGGRWLTVTRAPGRFPTMAPAAKRMDALRRIVASSPVHVANPDTEKTIRQADGLHYAISFDPHPSYEPSHRIIPLEGIGGFLPMGVLPPEDAAWIAKRCLFLAAALAKARLRFAPGTEPEGCVAIDADSHMLILVAPDALADGTGDIEEQRHAVSGMLGAIADVLDMGGYSGRRLAAFFKGVTVDRVTETSSLLSELDDLLLDCFGTPRFHRLVTI